MVSVKNQRLKSLQAGRPPLAKSARTMSRKASRTLINSHHQLQKKHRQAVAQGDRAAEAALSEELAKLGGLDRYQKASLQGQSHDRGGDTSRVLLEWLPVTELKRPDRKLRMLEVGSLSTRNACTTSGLFDMVHIDLNSQEPGIEQQDFMERPLPQDDSQKFDIISLSLVLNYVPEAEARGHMLTRTLSFLREQTDQSTSTAVQSAFPSLFMVLPRSCVTNSRYFTDERLEDIMNALGYQKLREKLTQKLTYSLWKRVGFQTTDRKKFPKKELNPGKARNNFVITLG